MLQNKAVISRRIHFSCGHRYYQPQFTEEENKQHFGSCYSEHGHGHNYILEAYYKGEIDAKTGMVINLFTVDDMLKKVTDVLDHQHLNFDVPYFKDVVPTTENIAKYCYEELAKLTPQNIQLQKVRLFENSDLWADYGYL